MASASSDKRLECPICLETFEKPIRQCIIGHSFCGKCLDPMDVKKCPECRSNVLETRNYKLEELLEEIPFPCINKPAGCPYVLAKKEMGEHILECKHRTFKCEGKNFCNWKCNWEGHDIYKHFKTTHIQNSHLEFTATVSVPYNDKTNFCDIQIIAAHYQHFWYKHKNDIQNKKVYWAFQYIGPRKQAQYYYYEFEIFNQADETRKYKITEYCKSDIEDINQIFESETCVVISQAMLKSYVKDGNYSFRFRLMKKQNPEKSAKGTRSKSEVRKPMPLLPTPPIPNPVVFGNNVGLNWLPYVPHEFDRRRRPNKK